MDRRLRTYVERVWMPERSDWPVAVTLGRAPDGHDVAEEYSVLPHPRAPRFLVPVGSRRTAAAFFRNYVASRSRRSRLLRRSVAASFASGLAERAFRHRLVVSVDRRFPRERWTEVLLVRHLADVLDQPDVQAFVEVRRVNPAAKPTLQLLDGYGRPVGFARVGATPPTRALVRTEAAALAALAGRLDTVIVPRLLADGDWHQTAYAVGAPLPAGMRRWDSGPDATAPLVAQIARSAGSTHGPLAGSAYAARLRADLAALPSSDDVAPVLTAWLARLEQQPHPLEFGRQHGDWIPNNLGRLGDRAAVWDWEFSVDDAPVGFDLLHWGFHLALSRHGLPAAVAAAEAATPLLAHLDVPLASRRLMVSAYLLDMFVRWTRLVAGTGEWNPKWYPDLLDVARHRDLD